MGIVRCLQETIPKRDFSSACTPYNPIWDVYQRLQVVRYFCGSSRSKLLDDKMMGSLWSSNMVWWKIHTIYFDDFRSDQDKKHPFWADFFPALCLQMWEMHPFRPLVQNWQTQNCVVSSFCRGKRMAARLQPEISHGAGGYQERWRSHSLLMIINQQGVP